jgi:hypothetical protein
MDGMSRFLIGLVVAFSATQAQAGFITTTFAGGNNQSGNMFDVSVGSNALIVQSLGLHLNTGTWTIQVYEKSGTWVGSQNNSAAWTLVDTIAGVVGGGFGVSTFVNVVDFVLGANATTGLYITTTAPFTDAMFYTNGTAVGNVAAANADLTVREGAGISYPFADTFTPRIWNGTINYAAQVANPVPLPATAIPMGLGALILAFGFRRGFPLLGA